MRKEMLKVNGMHCGSCAMLIHDALDDIGVKDAVVSNEKKTVEVVFDESKISLESIVRAIRDEGYEVEL